MKNLNNQIFNATVKYEQPNDLLDSQDRLLGQLTNIADVKVEKDQYGRAFVSLKDDGDIVNANEVNKLEISDNQKVELV